MCVCVCICVSVCMCVIALVVCLSACVRCAPQEGSRFVCGPMLVVGRSWLPRRPHILFIVVSRHCSLPAYPWCQVYQAIIPRIVIRRAILNTCLVQWALFLPTFGSPTNFVVETWSGGDFLNHNLGLRGFVRTKFGSSTNNPVLVKRICFRPNFG